MRRLNAACFMLSMSVSMLVSPGWGEEAVRFDTDPAAVRPGTYELNAGNSKITWTIDHYGLSHYRGQFADLSGTLTIDPGRPEQATLQVTVPMDGLGTLHERLDAHLRSADFFDMERFPTATFTATHIERIGDRQASVTGDLTLHGVTRPVTFTSTFNAAGVHPVTKKYLLGFDGVTTIRRSDFGMTYGVPGLGDEVQLDLEAEFQAAK